VRGAGVHRQAVDHVSVGALGVAAAGRRARTIAFECLDLGQ
jgi:hypothetical protein